MARYLEVLVLLALCAIAAAHVTDVTDVAIVGDDKVEKEDIGSLLTCPLKRTCKDCLANSKCAWGLLGCFSADLFNSTLTALRWSGDPSTCDSKAVLDFTLKYSFDSVFVYNRFEGFVPCDFFTALDMDINDVINLFTGAVYPALQKFFSDLAKKLSLRNSSFVIFGGKTYSTSLSFGPLAKMVTSPSILVNYATWNEQTKFNNSMFMIAFDSIASYPTSKFSNGYLPGSDPATFIPITDLTVSSMDTSSKPWKVVFNSKAKASPAFSLICAFSDNDFSYGGKSYEATEIKCDVSVSGFVYSSSSGNGLVLKTVMLAANANFDARKISDINAGINMGRGFFNYEKKVTATTNNNKRDVQVYHQGPTDCDGFSWLPGPADQVLQTFSLNYIKCSYFSFAGNNDNQYYWDPSYGTDLRASSDCKQ